MILRNILFLLVSVASPRREQLTKLWFACATALATFALGPTLAWADPNPNGASSKFRIMQHGFNFKNNFRSKMIVDLPGFGRVDLASNRYGLCGGMIYSAHDSYWVESTTGRQTKTPDQADGKIPNQGSKLRTYIWDRQMDSLKKDNWRAVRKLLDWMKKPLDDKKVAGVRVSKGLKTLTKREFSNKIAPRIDKGWAVPLLLVNAKYGDKNAFTRNHQVLAIGYQLHTRSDGKQEWDIRIYDPNCPDLVKTLHTGSRTNTCGNTKFRGLFVTQYRGQKPYWVSGDSPGPPSRGFKPGAEQSPLRDPFGTGGKGPGKVETLPHDPQGLE